MSRMNMNIMRMLQKAAEASEGAAKAKIASALVKSGHILGLGFNRMKTDPLQAKFGKNKDAIYLHSEIACIKNALRENTLKDIEGSTLYICRVKYEEIIPRSKTYRLTHGLARPCEGCMRAIAEFKIRNVIYTTDKFGCFEMI